MISLLAFIPFLPAAAQDTEPAPASEGRFHVYTSEPDMQAPRRNTSLMVKGFQYGAWLNPTFVMDQKNDNTSLVSSITTARLWIKAPLWQNSFVYVRGKDVFMGTLYDNNYGAKNVDNLVDLDQAYITMSTGSRNLWLTMGRSFFRVGTGVVLNDRGDGGQAEIYTPFGNMVLFGMYTGLLLEDNNPYGLSSEDMADGARRIFTGMTYSIDLRNNTVYAFGMAQIDKGKEKSGEKTRYQSQYWGLGGKGAISDKLTWYVEGFGETGKSYINGTGNKENILAFGGIAGANYYLKTFLKPVIQIQYGYGSGDADRTDQRKPDGNTRDNDTALVSFGSFSGGSGLRPDLVNLHVIRAGGSVLPIDGSLGKLMFITKYSVYMKERKSGDIYAAGEAQGAKEKSRFAGQGVDASLRWELFYDLGVYLNYGLFIPGDAYPSSKDDLRHFVAGGATISF